MHTANLLLASEKIKFEALFEHASLGILIIDEKGEIILANGFLIAMFGYTNEAELTGQKIEFLIPERFHRAHETERAGYAIKPNPRPIGIGLDLFGVKKDGTEFPAEVSLSNYKSGRHSFVIAFVSDITKRKEIENAAFEQKKQLAIVNKRVEQLNNELEQKVEKRTAELQQILTELEISKDELEKALGKEKELGELKSRFVSMASHEFRTPLSTILSSTALVSRYVKDEDQDKRARHINRIKLAVNNLTDILNDFLSIGKIEDGKIVVHFTLLDIKELIGSVCSDVSGIVKQGQNIYYQHKGDPMVCLDPFLLRNVMMNLLSNAIKFSPENGIINIESESHENQVFVTVKDNGIGISEADAHHLFERFFRGANVTNIQGTGLGLHIVENYVELMNGRIFFKSVLEKGTTFKITFNSNAVSIL